MLALLFFALGLYGLFAILIGVGYVIENHEIDIARVILIVTGAIAISASIPCTGMFIEREHPHLVKSSEFKVNTEIRIESINGVETSRDTVYIFTPRKK